MAACWHQGSKRSTRCAKTNRTRSAPAVRWAGGAHGSGESEVARWRPLSRSMTARCRVVLSSVSRARALPCTGTRHPVARPLEQSLWPHPPSVAHSLIVRFPVPIAHSQLHSANNLRGCAIRVPMYGFLRYIQRYSSVPELYLDKKDKQRRFDDLSLWPSLTTLQPGTRSYALPGHKIEDTRINTHTDEDLPSLEQVNVRGRPVLLLFSVKH